MNSLVRADIAPTGTLRVGINYGNPVLATRDAVSGELRGVAVDLALELGRRVGVPADLVAFESAGKLFDAVKAGAWDVAFLAIDPGRADEIDFTAAYIEIEGTYLVPPGSPLRAIADVDREGVRVGVSANSAYDLFLSRSLRHARLVRAPTPDAAFELILTGTVDVIAGVRQHLIANAGKLPGARVLEGRFMAIEQALGIPKGRDAGAKYLREFIEDVKASGLVARAIEKAGVRGVTVPPKAMV
ncbi:MAG: ABC transporter substrate-binding protein [Deltaproteobacteria bacterium]|nr:ABC transporter substrate-binding protein [Deltaproteobacteria bacterium]MBI3064559.1 ABC transporter substrate-binding protein [Deltaproteobacteria bacterium]